MKKSNIIAFGIIAVTVVAGTVFLFQGEYVVAVEASVSEIVEETSAFDSQLVITEGKVTDWEIREYTLTITGEDVNETHLIERYYLVIEDLESSDRLKVRLNYRENSLVIDEETFTVDEVISVEGLVKEFRFEELEEDLDIDHVILAKEIEKENGELVTILTDDFIEEFRRRRQEAHERRQNRNIEDYIEEITVEIISWECNEYNITVTGPDDFYKSEIVVRPLLIVENTETGSIILARVSYPRLNTSIEEDFISVGDLITLKGIIREGELNTEQFVDIEYDELMLTISITNADGESVMLISPEAFMNARPRRRFRILPIPRR